jgi:uncharacterized lipoprotein YddW (UPF0748 family)
MYTSRILPFLFLMFLSAELKAQAVNMEVAPKREFRGVWVATVENIDWPAAANSDADQQQKQLINLLNEHQRTGINAVMFQVRPAADAFYAKSREPWSKFLTGKQGLAPDPFYDPLELAITEAHKRGMELHAWFNPYRATQDSNFAALSPSHITNVKPEWFFIYGGKKLFNPGLPEVRQYIVQVILDVVDNYDVDGIHMDDYFYPYRIAGQTIADQETYRRYGKGFATIDDWRRNNVNQLIKMLGDSIHQHKPKLKFGMSPLGVWANKSQNKFGSDSRGGNTYYQQYADSRKWIKEGWIDYINPQLYRPLRDNLVAFDKMVDWWSYNTYGKHLYIGQAPYQLIEKKLPAFRQAAELPNQIRYLRKNLRVQGSVFFSSRSLIINPLGFTDSLRNHFYNYPALPPVMLWLDSVAPNPPLQLEMAIEGRSINMKWQPPVIAADAEPIYGYVIYRFNEGEAINLNNAQDILSIRYDAGQSYTDSAVQSGKRYTYVITALDRLKNESEGSLPQSITAP